MKLGAIGSILSLCGFPNMNGEISKLKNRQFNGEIIQRISKEVQIAQLNFPLLPFPRDLQADKQPLTMLSFQAYCLNRNKMLRNSLKYFMITVPHVAANTVFSVW